MKNIKSVIFVCLAAMLAIGITACSEPMAYKQAIGVTASTTKTTYIQGEYFDPSTVTAVVEFTDGSTMNVDGSKLDWEITNGSTKLENGLFKQENGDNYTADVTISYGGVVGNSFKVVATKVKDIELGNLPATATWNEGNTAAEVDTDAITATVTLRNGAIRTLESGEFVITPEVDIKTGSPAAGSEIKDRTVTVKSFDVFGITYTTSATVTVSGIKDWTVDVAAATDAFDPDEEYNLYFEYKYEGTNGYTYPETPTTYYLGDSVTWTPYLQNVSSGSPVGEKHYINASDLIFPNMEGKEPAQKITLAADSDTKFSCTGVIYRGDIDVTANLVIPKGTTYVEDVEVTYDGTETITLKDADDTATIKPLDFKFKVYEYGADEPKTSFETKNVTILNPTITADDTGSYTIELLLFYGRDNKAHEVSISGPTVEVAETEIGG